MVLLPREQRCRRRGPSPGHGFGWKSLLRFLVSSFYQEKLLSLRNHWRATATSMIFSILFLCSFLQIRTSYDTSLPTSLVTCLGVSVYLPTCVPAFQHYIIIVITFGDNGHVRSHCLGSLNGKIHLGGWMDSFTCMMIIIIFRHHQYPYSLRFCPLCSLSL